MHRMIESIVKNSVDPDITAKPADQNLHCFQKTGHICV